MNIRQLGLFVDACVEGSLSAAAKRNCMTVQNVSRAVGDLERELDVRLFTRTSTGVVPTEAARIFLPYAQVSLRAFSLCESFDMEAATVQRSHQIGGA